MSGPATCPTCGLELKFTPEGAPIVCDKCAADVPQLVLQGLVIPGQVEAPDAAKH